MGKLLLVTVKVAAVPTQPEFGVKLAPGQPLGPQPAAVTGAGRARATSSQTSAA